MKISEHKKQKKKERKNFNLKTRYWYFEFSLIQDTKFFVIITLSTVRPEPRTMYVFQAHTKFWVCLFVCKI